jgi:hypothetical protein
MRLPVSVFTWAAQELSDAFTMFRALSRQRGKQLFYCQELSVAIDIIIALQHKFARFELIIAEPANAKVVAFRKAFPDCQFHTVNEPLMRFDNHYHWSANNTAGSRVLRTFARAFNAGFTIITILKPDREVSVQLDALGKNTVVQIVFPSETGADEIEIRTIPTQNAETADTTFQLPAWRDVAEDHQTSTILKNVLADQWMSKTSAYAQAWRFWTGNEDRLRPDDYVLLLCCDYLNALDYFDFVLSDARPRLLLCDTSNKVGELFSLVDDTGIVLALERFNPEPPAPEGSKDQIDWLRQAANVHMFTNIFWRNAPMPAEVSVRSFVGFLRNISIANFLDTSGVPVYLDLISRDGGKTIAWPLGMTADQAYTLSTHVDLFGEKLARTCGINALAVSADSEMNMTAYTTQYPRLHRVFQEQSLTDLEARFPIIPDWDPGLAILFIDQPLWNYPDLDFNTTQKNVEVFLNALRESGAVIHSKPHPSWPDRTIMDGTSFQFDGQPFPPWLPGELIVGRYRAVLFFFSSTAAGADPDRRFTMLPLMKFESDAGYRRRMPNCQKGIEDIGPVGGEIDIDQLDTWVEAVVSRTR